MNQNSKDVGHEIKTVSWKTLKCSTKLRGTVVRWETATTRNIWHFHEKNVDQLSEKAFDWSVIIAPVPPPFLQWHSSVTLFHFQGLHKLKLHLTDKVKCKSNFGAKSYSGRHTGPSSVSCFCESYGTRFQARYLCFMMAILCFCHRGERGCMYGCTCHCNRLIIAGGAGRLVRIALLPSLFLLGERPGACAHWGWMTHNYHSDGACSHLPSSPAVSLTHLAHMTNDKITPNLRPLTKTWLPVAHSLPTVFKAGISLPGFMKQNKLGLKVSFWPFWSNISLGYTLLNSHILIWPREQ